MRNSPLHSNRAYALLKTFWHAASSAFSSVPLFLGALFGKHGKTLSPNTFFEFLDFVFVSGPRHYWKRPTAIGAGRSLSTLLHFLLEKDRHFVEKTDKKGFTLVEVMVAVTVLSIIFVYGLQSLGQIAGYRTNVSDRVDLGQDLYYNVERLVDVVKEGGVVDYEEYWNRTAVGTGMTAGTISAGTVAGHYSAPSGFGNYGDGGNIVPASSFGAGQYVCLSGTGTQMGTGGCLSSFNTTGGSEAGKPQRYGEYALQSFDANINADDDGGDEDGNGSILGDEDDEELGAGPAAFVPGMPLRELYLVKKNGAVPERLILRWSVSRDPNAPTAATCSATSTGAMTGSGCLGHLEMLRLVGRDYGISHSGAVLSAGRYDGKIDTWECRSDFYCAGAENTPVGTGSTFDAGTTEWVSVFPDDINVSDVSFFPYPHKDYKLSWKENDPTIRIAPYVRIDMTLGFSWVRRKKINNGSDPQAHVTTSVSLSE